MKKLILITSLIALALFFNACSPGYVSSQPSYSDEYRPQSPSNAHVWIGGNWNYNRRSRSYNRGNGYWALPNRGRTYQQGEWHTNQRGSYWTPGKWR